MRDPWAHVGRLWTNGEPFLAVDSALRGAWRGYSNDDFEQVIMLGWQCASIPVGDGRAFLVGGDGVVRDDSWIEVFQARAGLVALVQASGPGYPAVLARALGYPAADDHDGGAITVASGELALFSAADDGTGPYSGPLVTARPGQVPPEHGSPTRGVDPGLLIAAPHAGYQLKVRWYTRLDEDNCFARWLLIPVQADG
jgi:hypothetical protein